LERFDKFSGLSGIRIKKMYKKSEKSLESIPPEGLIKDYIKPGDKIIFEIECSEFWLQIDMNLKCLDQDIWYKTKFDLKLSYCSSFLDLKYILLNIGIKLFSDSIINNNEEKDGDYCPAFSLEEHEFYLITNFNFINKCGQLRSINNLDEKVQLMIPERTISCCLTFSEFNNLIYNSLKGKEKTKDSIEKNKTYVKYLLSNQIRQYRKALIIFRKL
jgi:hypothetical protein